MSVVGLLLGGIALVGALIVAFFLIKGSKVTPVLGALPAAIPVAGTWLLYRGELASIGSKVRGGPPDQWVALAVDAMSGPLDTLAACPTLMVAPALVLLIAAAVAGVRGDKRRYWLAALGVVLTIVLVVAPAVALSQVGGESMGKGLSELMVGPRLSYPIMGLLASVALLSANREKSGPEAGAIGALVVGLGVAAVEIGALGFDPGTATSALAAPDITDWSWAASASKAPGAVAVGVAAVFGLLGFLGMGLSGGATRWLGGLVGLVLLVVGPAALALIQPAQWLVDKAVDMREDLYGPGYGPGVVDLQIHETDVVRPIPWAHTLAHAPEGLLIDGKPLGADPRAELAQLALDALERAGDGEAPILLHQVDGSADYYEVADVLKLAAEAGWTEQRILSTPSVGALYSQIPVYPKVEAPHYDDDFDALDAQVVLTPDGIDIYGRSQHLYLQGPHCDSVFYEPEDCEDPECMPLDDGNLFSPVYKEPEDLVVEHQKEAQLDDYDVAGMAWRLATARAEHLDRDEVLILVDPEVDWDVVARTLETLQEQTPAHMSVGTEPLFPVVRVLTQEKDWPWEPPLAEPPWEPPVKKAGPKRKLVVLGGLDRAIIDQVIRNHMNKIRYCYQKELVKDPRLKGKVIIRFIIKNDGTVSKAEVKSSELGNATVDNCVNERFYHMVFPPPTGGGQVIVSYPFNFAPGE